MMSVMLGTMKIAPVGTHDDTASTHTVLRADLNTKSTNGMRGLDEYYLDNASPNIRRASFPNRMALRDGQGTSHNHSPPP